MNVTTIVPERVFYHFIPTGGLSLGIAHPARRMTVKLIQDAVSAYYGLSPEFMTRQDRTYRYSHPRQLAMYMARNLTGQSLPDIGRRFHRDHSTIIHAVKAVEKRISDDDHTARDLTAIRAELAA